MKSSILFIVFLVFASVSYGQVELKNLYKTWIKYEVKFSQGDTLPEGYTLKNDYLKYTFNKDNTFNVSTVYFELGDKINFQISHNIISTVSEYGTILNQLLIKKLSKNTLILLQKGRTGFDDPNALVLYFRSQSVDQLINNKLSPDDIFSVRATDTVYTSSPKIYAQFKGVSFQRYIYNEISKDIKMDGRADNLVSFFQISKLGVADSVRIVKGIDRNFDRKFLAAFSKAKKDWTPAVFDGKNVVVRMKVELQYSTSDSVIPSDFAERDGDEAFNNKDYSVALYYFDLAFEKTPFKAHLLYKRGLCKLMLGNAPWACQDWQLALKVGDDQAVKMVLLKYCR